MVKANKARFSFKWAFVIILLSLILIVVLQNIKTCDVRLLFMTVTNVPIFLLILSSLFVGAVLGAIITLVIVSKTAERKRKEK